MVSFEHILFAVDEAGIALVTINRPEKRNALSRAVMGELGAAFDRVAEDPAIRAAIITGAGDTAFVAGADIGELEGLSGAEMGQYALDGQRVLRRLETAGKPSVAAVNGFALGGGLELAMAATVRVASENSRLGQPEARLGLIPGFGGTAAAAAAGGPRARALDAGFGRAD